MHASDLTIVIPCHDEEASLPEVVPRLLSFCEEHRCFLVVVDDGSRDGSRRILAGFRHPRLRVVRHKLNRGYGAAIKSGVYAAGTRYVVTVDADGQHRPEDILRLYRAAREQDADMVVGERDGSDEASAYRALGKALIRLFVRTFLRVGIRDINSGLKLYDRRLALRFFPFCPDGMAYSDVILLFFLQYRLPVASVPIRVLPRRAGESAVGTMTAVKTFYELWLIVILFHPFRFFAGVAVGIAVLALLWTVRCYLRSNCVSTGSCLLWVMSTAVFFLGVVTEQLYRFRKQQIRLWEDDG